MDSRFYLGLFHRERKRDHVRPGARQFISLPLLEQLSPFDRVTFRHMLPHRLVSIHIPVTLWSYSDLHLNRGFVAESFWQHYTRPHACTSSQIFVGTKGFYEFPQTCLISFSATFPCKSSHKTILKMFFWCNFWKRLRVFFFGYGEKKS